MTTYLMLIELPPKKMGWPYWDKVQHILVFLILTGLALSLFFKQRWRWVLGLAMYGALIEWLQATLTITRMATVGDWLADITGIAIAVMVFVLIDKLCIKPAANLISHSA
ncbi:MULTISPECIES: VanZ family protein [Methylotenera]|uniref:VanZ family protein n=1 Tax=Methylotenera TaxID=359407 RepID=UPI001E48EF53|nr:MULTISPECIES: VanZ family protein [Methylotenera]